MTIKDVAKEAKVSVATISRVINNDKKVSAKTRERVLDVINKIGYVPNVVGRNLRINKTGKILVIVSELYGNIYNSVIDKIINIAEKNNYTVFFAVTNNVADKELKYINTLKNKSVDGIILLGTSLNASQLEILKNSFSIVMALENIQNFDFNYLFKLLVQDIVQKVNTVLTESKIYFIKA